VQEKASSAAQDGKKSLTTWTKNPRAALLAGGGALALIVAVAAGSFMFGKGDSDSSETGINLVTDLTGPVDATNVGELISAERALAEDARKAGVSATAVNGLVAAGEQLDKQAEVLQTLVSDPTQASAATARTDEIKRTATSANVDFANALLRDAEAQAQRLSADASSSAAGARLTSALSDLRTSVQASASVTDPAQSLGAARDALAKSQAFAAALPAAYRAQTASKRPDERLPQAPRATTVAGAPLTAPVTATTTAPTVTESTSTVGVSSAKRAQFNGVISSGRSMAQQVIRMGSGASGTRKSNAALAKNYDSYLAKLADSFRGANSDREADELIKKANQTKAYIVFLNKQSSAAE
jgi:hypothetical protein